MKLLYRLVATLTISLSILAALYFALPALLTGLARYQLQQLGFSTIELKIDSVGLNSTRLSQLQLSSQVLSIDVQGLQIAYQPLALLGGELESIELAQLRLSQLASAGEPAPVSLPDPAVLSVFLSTPLAELFPASSLSVDELLVYAADGHQTMSASGSIQKQGQQVLHGEFQLRDRKLDNYQLKLNSSPQTGLDFELYPLQESATRLASVKLNTGHQGEVAGRLSVDLTAISFLLDIPASLSGVLNAEFAYSTRAGRASNPFMLNLDGRSLLISGWQLDLLTSQLHGEIELAGSQLKLTFEDDAEMQAKGIVQDGLVLAGLRLQLPGAVSIAQNAQQFTISRDAGLVLDGLQLDGLSIPTARLSELGFKQDPDAELASYCTVNAVLDMPLLEIDAVRFELTQLLLEGRCPLAPLPTAAWEMNALFDTLVYEDEEIRLPLDQCQLSIGNVEKGRLLDEDPAELGGRLHCESESLNAGVLTQFRLHAGHGVGRADFSVTDIQPDDEHPLLASVFKAWAQPFEIVSGDMGFEGVYRWWKSGSGKHREKLAADITFRDAGGHYEGILFSGLNYQDTFELLPKFSSGGLSALSVRGIDIGLPVTGFSAMLGLAESTTGSLPIINIEDLGLSVLQGRISADPMLMDMNFDDQNLMLNIEGLNLQQIIAMQQLEGLTASGLLDGYMPVTLSADGVNVIDGRINARAPGGRIQYTPQDATDISSAAPGTELLMKILQDLNYHSMDVVVDYADDGEMDMQLSIKGLSPQVDTDRPVHFNLSLQQNLLTLLQSLRYVEGINNHIDKDVQDYYKQRKD